MLCSARQPSKATQFENSTCVSWKDLGARCWPLAPMAGGGLAACSPITRSTREAPWYQIRSSTSPCSHYKGKTILVRLPRPGNPSPAATAASVTHGGTGSACPSTGSSSHRGSKAACAAHGHHGQPRGVGTGKAVARGTLLLAPCGCISGRRNLGAGGGTCQGAPTSPPGQPGDAGAAGTWGRSWGPTGISPEIRRGGPAGHSAVTHAAPGDFCHGRAYAFRICLSFFFSYSFI